MIDDYFRTDSYKESYAHAIVPFPKPDSIDDEGSVISFPEHHQTRARTKQRWILSQGEKIHRPVKCGKCGEISNHNKKTCQTMPA